MNTDFFRRSAVLLLRIEAAVILALLLFLIYATFTSDVTYPLALIGEILFGIAGATGLYFASVGFKNGKSYGRAPAVLANGIALGVAYYMIQGGDVVLLTYPLTLLALATLISALFGYKE